MVEIRDSAIRRLLRRLDNAGGGPTMKQWSQLVEADKAGRGEGARHTRNYLTDWLEIADRLGNEKAISKTLLKGPHLAEAGVPRASCGRSSSPSLRKPRTTVSSATRRASRGGRAPTKPTS